MKLEHLREIRMRGEHNFVNGFLEMVFQLLEEIIIYLRSWSVEFFEKEVP